MPYIFAVLVVVNLVVLGYFWTTPPQETGTLTTVQTQLQSPLDYENHSKQLPPLIGEKN